MSYERIQGLLARINRGCKGERVAHVRFGCTLVAAVIVMLGEYGEEELADRLEVVLFDKMLPEMTKRG